MSFVMQFSVGEGNDSTEYDTVYQNKLAVMVTESHSFHYIMISYKQVMSNYLQNLYVS